MDQNSLEKRSSDLSDNFDDETTNLSTQTESSKGNNDLGDLINEFGEIEILANEIDKEVSSDVERRQAAFERRRSSMSLSSLSSEISSPYGNRLSVAEASERISSSGVTGEGLLWKVTIIPDNCYQADGSLLPGLREKDFDPETKEIKPCRGNLLVKVSDFLSSLTKIEGENGPRWIFHGILNGWPALNCLELLSLEKLDHKVRVSTVIDRVRALRKENKVPRKFYWKADKEGCEGVEPSFPNYDNKMHIIQAVMRGAPWTATGWSKDSPGFAFWYETQRPEGPRMTYGTNIVKAVGDDVCTHVHMISHRYAVMKESPKDLLTYHTIALLEWEHGQYCTILEGAYLNGLGGYKGKCNWFHDKDEPVTSLYRDMPPEMVAPWLVDHAEIRCFDVGIKNLEEMKAYIANYEGNNKRFIDPHYTFSHRARLHFRTKSQIAQYIVNYISRDTRYSELKRNCQTFVADLCSFLCGKKGVQPFSPIIGVNHHNRTHMFLYDSTMFEDKK